jgi:hypothetical protein
MGVHEGLFAFPVQFAGTKEISHGMTLRDYFAAKAMAAIINEPIEGIQASVSHEMSELTAIQFSEAAYMFADAMLKERIK